MASIYEGLVDMFSLFLSFLSSGTPSLARDSFYPPLNHTTYITDSSLGPYGGIYAAPADQPSPASDDVYNYCSMPHPRADTYVLPSLIANSSVEARLVYLEYMQRHQRRTPYNILPAGEVRLAALIFITYLSFPPDLIHLHRTNPSSAMPSIRISTPHQTVALHLLPSSTARPTPTRPTLSYPPMSTDHASTPSSLSAVF